MVNGLLQLIPRIIHVIRAASCEVNLSVCKVGPKRATTSRNRAGLSLGVY